MVITFRAMFCGWCGKAPCCPATGPGAGIPQTRLNHTFMGKLVTTRHDTLVSHAQKDLLSKPQCQALLPSTAVCGLQWRSIMLCS